MTDRTSSPRLTGAIYSLVVILSCLVVAGCDSADDEAEEVFALAVVSEEASFSPGSAVELAVSGATVLVPVRGELVLSASAGETTVLIAPVRTDTLAFVVPAVAPGRHTLTVDLYGSIAEVSFTVAAYDEIEDPTAYVAGQVETLSASLGASIEAEPLYPVRSHLQVQQEKLDASLEEWGELPAEQQAMVAYYVRETMRAANTAAAKAVLADNDCLPDAFARELTKLGAGASLFALSVAGGTASLATAQPWFAVAFGITGAIGGAAFLDAAQDLKAMAPNVYGCVIDKALRIVEGSASGVQSSDTGAHTRSSMSAISFTHGVSKTFNVETGSSLQEDAAALLAQADALMHEYAAFIPDAWLTAFDAPEDIIWKPGAPESLALRGISDGRIEGTLEVPDDQVALTFSYRNADNQPAGTQNFAFTLGFGNETEEIEARLEPRTCWDASSFSGDWEIVFDGGSSVLPITVYSNGRFSSGTWTFYCSQNLLVVDPTGGYGTPWWWRFNYHFRPDINSTDSIPGTYLGSNSGVTLVRK